MSSAYNAAVCGPTLRLNSKGLETWRMGIIEARGPPTATGFRVGKATRAPIGCGFDPFPPPRWDPSGTGMVTSASYCAGPSLAHRILFGSTARSPAPFPAPG
ncbi:hypothetical protein B296_00002670, partial [Ensete ventricosum]